MAVVDVEAFPRVAKGVDLRLVQVVERGLSVREEGKVDWCAADAIGVLFGVDDHANDWSDDLGVVHCAEFGNSQPGQEDKGWLPSDADCAPVFCPDLVGSGIIVYVKAGDAGDFADAVDVGRARVLEADEVFRFYLPFLSHASMLPNKTLLPNKTFGRNSLKQSVKRLAGLWRSRPFTEDAAQADAVDVELALAFVEEEAVVFPWRALHEAGGVDNNTDE